MVIWTIVWDLKQAKFGFASLIADYVRWRRWGQLRRPRARCHLKVDSLSCAEEEGADLKIHFLSLSVSAFKGFTRAAASHGENVSVYGGVMFFVGSIYQMAHQPPVKSVVFRLYVQLHRDTDTKYGVTKNDMYR